jgi:hypothetical protein
MRKFLIITLIFVLTATLFAGCRRMGDTNPSSDVPTSSSTTGTQATLPELPLPSGTNTTSPSGSDVPDSAPELPNRMVRPSAKGPRY